MPARFTFDAPPDVAAEFRMAVGRVQAESLGVLRAGECLIEMIRRFGEVHVGPALKRSKLRESILRRDGWTCSMPHCRKTRNLHVHHVVYRSRGGKNTRENLITLCEGCHQLLHHGKQHAMLEDHGMSSWQNRIRVLRVRTGRAAVSSGMRGYLEGLRAYAFLDPRAWCPDTVRVSLP